MKNSSSSPPSKRSRRFFIEELLREPYNELSPPKKAPKDYIKKLDSEIEHVPKFKLVKNKSRFIIKDIPADPEALLMGVFQHCMDEAIIDSRQSGVEPTHLGCIVSSQNLSSDIWIPIRQLTPDTINTILNRFNDVAQSKKQDGVTLWGEPFTVTVTTINRNALPAKRQLKGGAARKLAPVHHNIHPNCLIKIQNFDDDNYCLFYAIQATLVRSIGDLDRRRFHDYVNGNSEMRGKLKNDALEMMNAVNAPAGQPNYDAEVYVPRIVDWWNGEKFVGQWKFKTFVFRSAGHYKPLFKYGPEDYVVPIILYFEEGHFNGVQKSGNLFGKPYCLSCEKTYDRPKRHIVNCKARCIKCPKNEARGWRLVIFDLETMQHEPVDPQIPERRKHQVNFVTAKVACPDCISNGQWKESLLGKKCNICGYHRTITFSQMPFNGTTVERQVIDRHPLVSFVKWILYNLPKQYDTIAYSHFGGRFDMVLVFRELFMEGLNPSMIKNGNRLLEMKVKSRKKLNPNISFRDSWNLVPGPLASLVPMFGLDVQDKPFFPHLANRPENYGCQIFPTKSNYLAGGMNPEKRKEFDIWYAQNRNQPFLLDEALASYCKNDVDILMAGLIAFRTEFLEMSKRPADPDGKANRAAYTTPHNGIDPLKHCITIASACMRHFRTNHLKPGHLDLVPEKGYDSCGDNQSRIRERNKQRMEFILTKVPNVEIFWQCEIEEMLSKDREMKQKFKEYTGDGGPINIRDCFMGGRTGALKLYHELAADEEISYYYFTSLYPFINCVTDYPVGHPTLHVPCEDVDWRRPEDNPYPLAILKVFVIPPRKIDVPVLPVKLNAALEEGYRVTMLLRVLEYNKSDNQLFRPYMSEFMVQKLHASGFDEEIRGNFEAEEQFIKECREKFDIKIDRAKMVPNKGKRALAKLAVNNLWGRFSLRNYGLSQTFITDDPSELGNYLDNRKIEVTGLDMLTPERILISYNQKKDWVQEHPCSNVVISLFTTSAARLHLLKAMQKVARTPDTDSLIYVHPKGANPLKTGPHLGEFTDEFPKHDIMEFVSGGAKQYGLKLRKKGSENEFDYVLKLRGITLNYDNLYVPENPHQSKYCILISYAPL
ncbi:hypothetical protein niasHS_016260 [Heterodera schachtii]|uniref:DNA-directed DNA polymerase n=1 Tax=Heterodera schachtii TaxID=97005 RepID=A0ABD2HQ99_HETSC